MKTLIQVFLTIVSYIGVVIGILAIVPQVTYRLFDKKYDLWYYFHQIALSNDNTVGTLVYGSKHTISAITGQKAFNGSKYHRVQGKTIDTFFGKEHCLKQALEENLIKAQDDKSNQ